MKRLVQTKCLQVQSGCSSFKALDRQLTKKASVDESGDFGATCARQGFPLAFMNMSSGGEK